MDKKITFYKWIGKKFLKWINLIFCAVADGQIGDDDAQVNHDEQKSEHPEPQTGLKRVLTCLSCLWRASLKNRAFNLFLSNLLRVNKSHNHFKNFL